MEIWKDIKGYEGYYQVSDLGRVRSLDREVLNQGKNKFIKKGKLLKQTESSNGYNHVFLCKNGKPKIFHVHQLVAMVFLNHKPCGFKLVVNHVNFNKKDNRLVNLEIVTNRENCNQKHLKSTSKYVGVCFSKKTNKWQASIIHKHKTIYLGQYKKEINAHLAYQEKLKQIT